MEEQELSSAQEKGPMRFARAHASLVELPSAPIGVKGFVPTLNVIGVPIEAVGKAADESRGIIRSPGGTSPARTSSRRRSARPEVLAQFVLRT